MVGRSAAAATIVRASQPVNHVSPWPSDSSNTHRRPSQEDIHSHDRAEFAMHRKLARQKPIAIDGQHDDMPINHWGIAPATKVLESDVDFNDLVADTWPAGRQEVLKEGALKKRIVTRTIEWANRHVTLTPDEILISNEAGGDHRDSILLLDITECSLHTLDDRVR